MASSAAAKTPEPQDNGSSIAATAASSSIPTTTATATSTSTTTTNDGTSTAISKDMSNEEQIQRLNNMSTFYTENGYHRKSAFYKRLAALKAVSLNLPEPDWSQCYHLLIEALDGYNLTLDPTEYERKAEKDDRIRGWVGIHLQLLQELVTTAKRMKAEQLAMRHLSFLLHSLFEFLSTEQRQEFASKLLALSTKNGEGAPVPLTLENGLVIPSVNLTKFPFVTSFKLQSLPTHLKPFKLLSKADKKLLPSSPFIYTPMQLNRPVKKTTAAGSQSVDFRWVENEPSEVSIQVRNYLPIELVVSHINLMTDGIAFEVSPTSLTLEADSLPALVTLTGTPRGHGNLEVLGYTTHVLGIKSNCLLRELPRAKRLKLPVNFAVEVVAPLPLLSLSCPDLPKSSMASPLTSEIDFIAASYSATVYMGETRSCLISLSNSSCINGELVELVSVRVISKLKKHDEAKFITFASDINDSLPLAPGANLDFRVNFFGIGENVSDAKALKSELSSPAPASGRNSPSHTKKQPLQLGAALANFLSELQPSSTGSVRLKEKAAESRANTGPSSSQEFPSKIIDIVIEFEYSGGPGLSSGFCRKSALRFNVEILPSVLITMWDVVPAEIPSRCFLVLDVLNATNMEMELNYSANKSILIESKETCRVPVSVERCPLITPTTAPPVEPHHQQQNQPYSAIHESCKSHLIDQVNLRYTLLGSPVESQGRAFINNIPWSDIMLTTILMSPLQWQVKLNNIAVVLDKPEFSCKVGDRVTLEVELFNISERPLKALCLKTQLFQDLQNGNKNYRLDMKRAIFGGDKALIDEIPPSQSYRHECTIVFFYAGQFKVEIDCTGDEQDDAKTVESSDQERNERQQSATKSGPHYNVTVSQSDQKRETCSKSLWKCTPLIEISVSD